MGRTCSGKANRSEFIQVVPWKENLSFPSLPAVFCQSSRFTGPPSGHPEASVGPEEWEVRIPEQNGTQRANQDGCFPTCGTEGICILAVPLTRACASVRCINQSRCTVDPRNQHYWCRPTSLWASWRSKGKASYSSCRAFFLCA